MSDPVPALADARFDGYCRIEELAPTGMIVLRADLSDPAVAAALETAIGTGIPAPLGIRRIGDNTVGWMSPDELLLRVPRAYVPDALTRLRDGLRDTRHLVCDVSDARARFRVDGPAMREVLAKLTPADTAPQAMPPGALRRTRLAQVAAAIEILDDHTAEVLCFRSVARYVFDLLCTAARPGSEAHVFARPDPEEQ